MAFKKKKKQTDRPRSDAAVCDVWSGSTGPVLELFHQIWDQQNHVERKNKGCIQAVHTHALITLSWG